MTCCNSRSRIVTLYRLPCFLKKSDSSGNFPGAEATGAGVDVGRFSVDYRLDALYIGLISTIRASVGMGNLDAETDFLSAKITFCH